MTTYRIQIRANGHSQIEFESQDELFQIYKDARERGAFSGKTTLFGETVSFLIPVEQAVMIIKADTPFQNVPSKRKRA